MCAGRLLKTLQPECNTQDRNFCMSITSSGHTVCLSFVLCYLNLSLARQDITVASEDPEINKEILQAMGNTKCDDSSECFDN